MSTICPNCGARLGCGCQLRVASNGVRVCEKCIVHYEANLNSQKQAVYNPAVNNSSFFPNSPNPQVVSIEFKQPG